MTRMKTDERGFLIFHQQMTQITRIYFSAFIRFIRVVRVP